MKNIQFHIAKIKRSCKFDGMFILFQNDGKFQNRVTRKGTKWAIRIWSTEQKENARNSSCASYAL